MQDTIKTDSKQSELKPDEIEKLIEKCSEGDTESLKVFFSHYSSDMYNFPIKVFHLDEDSASEFFLYAYERLQNGKRFKSFQGRSSFRTWFYTVLRNLLIDWMRTVRELETVNYTRVDDEGNEYRMIENTPDPLSIENRENYEHEMDQLKTKLFKLNMDLRLVFKLSYLYYLELDQDEIKSIAERGERTVTDVVLYLSELRNDLAEKELKNIEFEDKITSLYLSVLDLKTKRDRLLSDIKKEAPGMKSLSYIEVEKLDHAIEKKYQQRAKLLEKKQKGHFVVRTPYKFVGEIMGIPEGSVSVQMMRATEKLKGL